MLPSSESEIDLTPYIYEYTNLMLPYQKIPCEIDKDTTKCNQEVLKKLNNFLIAENHSEEDND